MFNYNLLKLIRHVRNVYHIARALESAFLAATQPNRIVESSILGFIYIYLTIESFEYSNIIIRKIVFSVPFTVSKKKS